MGPDVGGLSACLMRVAGAREPVRGQIAAREIVLEALDLLLLAIHEINVVAQEQVQVLDASARELQLDRIELKQQIVAERAHQRQARGQRMAEFVDEGAQNRKRRGLLAALFFGEQRGQRFQRPAQRAVFERETFSQCGWSASSGSRMRFRISPRGLSARNSTSRPAAIDLERRRDGARNPSANIAPDIRSPKKNTPRAACRACAARHAIRARTGFS